MKLLIINGPNLNLLGTREPEIYGSESFESYFDELKKIYLEAELSYFQSNIEGELINQVHQAEGKFEGIILNAAAYTHTSVALADALAATSTPVVEVHISNVLAREAFRHQSLLAKHCQGLIAGFGLQSYDLAIQYFLSNSYEA